MSDKEIKFIHTNLTDEQKAEAEFLRNLVKILRNTDLSKLDLKGQIFDGDHREYNVLVDNYEISVRQTPVYAYPRKWNRIFCFGKWVFEPGKYERYQLDITENAYSARQADYAHKYYSSAQPGNQIMLAGTMATDWGQFNPSRVYINRGGDDYENLCLKQNGHLFDAARDLYFVLDTEYKLRQITVKHHCLPDVETSAQRSDARARLLKKLQGKTK